MLIDHDDHYEFPLQGAIIGRIIFDYQTHLITQDSDDISEFTLECSFTIESADASISVDPEQLDSLAPVLTLLHQPLTVARAYKEGQLEIEFADGRRIVAPINDRYEAWSLHGSGGLLIVSLPGGTVDEWLPQPEADA